MTDEVQIIELKQKMRTLYGGTAEEFEEKFHAEFTPEERRAIKLSFAHERLEAAKDVDPATLSEKELEGHEFMLDVMHSIIADNQPFVAEKSSDRALDLARFIVESKSTPGDPEFLQIMIGDFGDLNREQVERGIAIGSELLTARATEY